MAIDSYQALCKHPDGSANARSQVVVEEYRERPAPQKDFIQVAISMEADPKP